MCRGQPLCGKTIKIRVKNREPLPSYAMEMSDEYQDMGNPGGGVAVVNIPMAHHQHSPDSPLVSVFIFFFFFYFIYDPNVFLRSYEDKKNFFDVLIIIDR